MKGLHFPSTLPSPDNYYQGIGQAVRPITQNVLMFMRLERTALQQKHFANRSHHRHVLTLVLETPGSVIVNGAEIPLREGDALLVQPFQFHHFINLERDRLQWLFITFELSEASAPLEELAQRVLPQDPSCLALWSELAGLWQRAAREERDEILPLLDRLLMKMSWQTQHGPGRRIRPGITSWIAKAQSKLLEAVEQGWTLETVAGSVGLSERQFRNRFEAETGVTIRQYRANYQLHRALALMRDSRLSLTQVAELVGFQSSAAFTRFIRRETGSAPLALRRRLREER